MLVWHNCHVGILQLGPMKVSTIVTAPGEKACITEQAIKQKTINRDQWWLVEMIFKTNDNKTLFMSLWFKKKKTFIPSCCCYASLNHLLYTCCLKHRLVISTTQNTQPHDFGKMSRVSANGGSRCLLQTVRRAIGSLPVLRPEATHFSYHNIKKYSRSQD